MKTQWFAGMQPSDKENFNQQLLQSKKVLDKLTEIVYNMLKDREDVDRPDYDSPSWSHLQAHNNGAREMARLVLDLINTES